MTVRFDDVDTWIFDLDHTLYAPSANLFAQIDARMTTHIMGLTGLGRSAADRLRQDYWRRYGVTLKGLIEHHGADASAFLDDVHAIDYGALRPAPGLARALSRLPGRKIIHTNGPRAHADRVLARLGLDDHFPERFGIDCKGLIPKPDPAAYAHVLERAGVEPGRAAMIEDTVRNLEVPKRLGLRTVWLCPRPKGPAPLYVDRRIGRLKPFLEAHARP